MENATQKAFTLSHKLQWLVKREKKKQHLHSTKIINKLLKQAKNNENESSWNYKSFMQSNNHGNIKLSFMC